jgi:hypothetical protein
MCDIRALVVRATSRASGLSMAGCAGARPNSRGFIWALNSGSFQSRSRCTTASASAGERSTSTWVSTALVSAGRPACDWSVRVRSFSCLGSMTTEPLAE